MNAQPNGGHGVHGAHRQLPRRKKGHLHRAAARLPKLKTYPPCDYTLLSTVAAAGLVNVESETRKETATQIQPSE